MNNCKTMPKFSDFVFIQSIEDTVQVFNHTCYKSMS